MATHVGVEEVCADWLYQFAEANVSLRICEDLRIVTEKNCDNKVDANGTY